MRKRAALRITRRVFRPKFDDWAARVRAVTGKAFDLAHGKGEKLAHAAKLPDGYLKTLTNFTISVSGEGRGGINWQYVKNDFFAVSEFDALGCALNHSEWLEVRVTFYQKRVVPANMHGAIYFSCGGFAAFCKACHDNGHHQWMVTGDGTFEGLQVCEARVWGVRDNCDDHPRFRVVQYA